MKERRKPNPNEYWLCRVYWEYGDIDTTVLQYVDNRVWRCATGDLDEDIPVRPLERLHTKKEYDKLKTEYDAMREMNTEKQNIIDQTIKQTKR